MEGNGRKESPCYCIKVRRGANALTKFYDRALEPTGLTTSQFSLLNNIKRLGGGSKSALAQQAGLDRTTIIRNLEALRGRGLVEEAPGENRRGNLIRLTALGEAAVAEGMGPWKRAQKQLKAAVGPERLEEFLQVLTEIEALS